MQQRTKYPHAMYRSALNFASAKAETGFAILGKLYSSLFHDPKFQKLCLNISNGQGLALVALTAALYLCDAAGLDPAHYIGRSQFPKYESKPIMRANPSSVVYHSPAINYWASFGNCIMQFKATRP